MLHGLVLTHGAGSNSDAPLLIEIANAFAAAKVDVIRYDLPFRQKRRFGPPSPATAALDREGLANMVAGMRQRVAGKVFLGGHSYGGRQATMLAAERPGLVDGLLLLSYPLHPARKPEQLRTAHFAEMKTPSLFVHGTRDPFGSIEEMTDALRLIQCGVKLIAVEGAGHDLKRASCISSLPMTFLDFTQAG